VSEATFVGVKNVSGGDKKTSYGGDMVVFTKDEIKVVDAALGQFLLSRTSYGAEEVPGQGVKVMLKQPFKRIPLHEALKFAKEPQNRSLAEAKAEADRETKIAERVKEELLKAGWKAPEEKPAVKAGAKLP
jgi:hypothetical protein